MKGGEEGESATTRMRSPQLSCYEYSCPLRSELLLSMSPNSRRGVAFTTQPPVHHGSAALRRIIEGSYQSWLSSRALSLDMVPNDPHNAELCRLECPPCHRFPRSCLGSMYSNWKLRRPSTTIVFDFWGRGEYVDAPVTRYGLDMPILESAKALLEKGPS